MKTYTITLTEKQAQTISAACEVLARLGIGQFRDALEYLPLKEPFPGIWHDEMQRIGKILQPMMLHDIDGWNSSLGIYHPQVRPNILVAWDIHKTIRHRLSWDAAIERGDTDGTTRDWSKMMGVNYDEPSKASTEPLPVIKCQ